MRRRMPFTGLYEPEGCPDLILDPIMKADLTRGSQLWVRKNYRPLSAYRYA